MGLFGNFQWGVRQSVETENQMTSVERVLEYIELCPEANLETEKENSVTPDWPHSGAITCTDVCLSYDIDSPLVLKDLTFDILPKEKVNESTDLETYINTDRILKESPY